jgi:hypothetical protein
VQGVVLSHLFQAHAAGEQRDVDVNRVVGHGAQGLLGAVVLEFVGGVLLPQSWPPMGEPLLDQSMMPSTDPWGEVRGISPLGISVNKTIKKGRSCSTPPAQEVPRNRL